MKGKFGNKEYLIEEYMETYFSVLNHNEQQTQNEVSKEEAYYLATNIANTYITEKIGNKEELIEEYMDIYNKSFSYNANKIKEQPNYFYISTENDLLSEEASDEFNTRKSR